VIGVGCVSHSENEANCQDGQTADHRFHRTNR
jgi:hypothetical protein